MYLRPAIATAGLLAILCEGCAKHPVEVLRRQAAKEERALSRHESDVFSDARYFVPLPDAAAASVEVLEGRGKVIDVSKNSVGTDWSYSGSVEIEEADCSRPAGVVPRQPNRQVMNRELTCATVH